MILNLKRNFAVLVSVCILLSCKGQTGEVKNSKIEPSSIERTDLNDSLVNDLGVYIETAILEGSSEDFMKRFDLQRFARLATYTEYSDDRIQEYQKGFTDGFSKGLRSLPNKIKETVDNGGFYDFLEYHYDSNTKTYRMLFRLFSETEGINYHDYELALKYGKFYIRDMYVYLTGENLSATVNRVYLLSLPKNLLATILKGDDSEDKKHLFKAVNSQKELAYDDTVEHLSKISGKLRHDKFYHVLNILASSNLGDSQYMSAMESMRKDFENDPTCHLLSIDYYFMKSDLDKTMEAINKLEEQTGDSFLNFQRGNIAFGLEKYDTAANYFSKLLEEYPSYDTARFSLITCHAILENHEKCITLLDDILAEEVYTLYDLTDFVESNEEDGTNDLISLAESNAYLKWKAKQKQ